MAKPKSDRLLALMEKPTKTAMMLSAVVAPGAGQFLQRRWAAGAFFLVLFLGCMLLLLLEILRPMIANIMISIDFAAHQSDLPLQKFHVARILGWFGLGLAVYLAGLLDTWMAHARLGREWARQHARLRAPPMMKS